MANFIYDRTAADVANKTSKGYINYTDLNRIGANINELYTLLNSAGYKNGTKINAKTNWVSVKQHSDAQKNPSTNMPASNIMTNNYITNVQILYKSVYCSAYAGRTVTPYTTFDANTGNISTLPTNFKFSTYNTFNNLEKVIYDLYNLIKDIIDNFRECDTFYCGE